MDIVLGVISAIVIIVAAIYYKANKPWCDYCGGTFVLHDEKMRPLSRGIGEPLMLCASCHHELSTGNYYKQQGV